MIFGFLFWSLLVLTVAFVAMAIVGVVTSNDDLTGLGVVFLFVVILSGWGVMGHKIELKTEVSIKTVNVAVGDGIAFLSGQGELVMEVTSVPEFEYVKNKRTVVIKETKQINMYGGITSKKYEFVKDSPETPK